MANSSNHSSSSCMDFCLGPRAGQGDFQFIFALLWRACFQSRAFAPAAYSAQPVLLISGLLPASRSNRALAEGCGVIRISHLSMAAILEIVARSGATYSGWSLKRYSSAETALMLSAKTISRHFPFSQLVQCQLVPPGECPGVAIAVSVWLPILSVSPSPINRSTFTPSTGSNNPFCGSDGCTVPLSASLGFRVQPCVHPSAALAPQVRRNDRNVHAYSKDSGHFSG